MHVLYTHRKSLKHLAPLGCNDAVQLEAFPVARLELDREQA